MKILIFAILAMTSQVQAGQDLFLFKKSLNPKNVLHYAVDMNADCSFKTIGAQYVNPYWIMGEGDGHVEGLTNKEKQIFSPQVTYMNQAKSEMDFTVAAVALLKEHLPDPSIKVQTTKTKTQCVAKAFMEIDKEEIELQEFYISGSITWTLDWKTDYMIISGKKADGTAFKKKIVP